MACILGTDGSLVVFERLTRHLTHSDKRSQLGIREGGEMVDGWMEGRNGMVFEESASLALVDDWRFATAVPFAAFALQLSDSVFVFSHFCALLPGVGVASNRACLLPWQPGFFFLLGLACRI